MGNAASEETDLQNERRCYYNVLEIERNASSDEIKKAYRKQALAWHPDKNTQDIETATSRFSEIQAAYEVLSDDTERAWYDGHRQQILRGESHDGGVSRDVSGISTDDLLPFFDSTKLGKYDDSAKGFYVRFRSLFDQLSAEEEVACESVGVGYRGYPSFGTSTSNELRGFYTAWGSFSSEKSFSWCDRYRDAPDRRNKRAMEKENKRVRDGEKKEYNDTIRSLVAFIKKRDPRYKAQYVDEKQRQRELLAASKNQAVRDKAAFQASLGEYKELDWTKCGDDESIHEDESEAPVSELYECVACRKYFKTEKQFESHAKSKKHLKVVSVPRWELKLGDVNMNEDPKISITKEVFADKSEVFSDKRKDKSEVFADKSEVFSDKREDKSEVFSDKKDKSEVFSDKKDKSEVFSDKRDEDKSEVLTDKRDEDITTLLDSQDRSSSESISTKTNADSILSQDEELAEMMRDAGLLPPATTTKTLETRVKKRKRVKRTVKKG
ncbi:DnaJ subfamily C member 21 [Neolecta irregularis DAH-3]|uniref:DnaJ subfamily C member 21 n=1 Tax=Neolecta irregularis (strain DAH-3) TaxID=1198029 RepID=A0A1U7LPX5_NEOID|nr:DnaJ subfamily C member 21 [Neolecta irregularis DAH-3]|eukprot:OLL24678.1 DnaJ subfamily C member 21 [Neolecta irregularis DAH-3]